MAHRYTVQESNNLAIGQGPSMFLNENSSDDSKSITPPTGTVFIAIQVINDCQFSQLLAEDNTKCYGTDGIDNSHLGGVGDRIPSAQTFPAGTVIYGRWSKIETNNGVIIAYCGG